ncbi:MAG TPA: polyhydroxyalkanoate synthesis regulator DNA-binding domain-containing protein [Gemmataceae bacterium]|nr:polyhydroxyalkanoate synthesis regulator DNA-binding domain-containing protein [Gemmataceae bacterium]
MAAAEQRPEGGPVDPAPVLITRYPNRRLYDRSRGRYVTLPEIADMVRLGQTVTVRDSKTGEDLTRCILTQIILEHYPERMELFPVDVLNCLIRTNEGVLGFLREYFHHALAYLELLRRPATANPFLLPMDWVRAYLQNVAPPPNPPGAAPPTGEADVAALGRRVAELERQLEELQAGAEGAPEARRQ